MFYRMRLRVLALAFLASAFIPGAQAEGPKVTVVQAIIDNGGTVMEEDAQGVINNFVAGLSNLRGHVLSNARIDLILTSHPTTVWSGTRKDLIEQAHKVLELVKRNDRCSDVGRALRQAQQNLQVAGADVAYIFIYSPMIFAPFPCDKGPGITLPQPVPEGLEIGKLLETYGVKAFKIFGVHASQEQVWTDYLTQENVIHRARLGEIDFAFLGFRQSETYLAGQQLLGRRRR